LTRTEAEHWKPVDLDTNAFNLLKRRSVQKQRQSLLSGNWQFEEHLILKSPEVFVEEANEVLTILQQFIACRW